MKWAALITWVLTAGGGFVLLSIWLARGGMRSQAAGNRIKPPLIMSHFLLAATGLVLWIVYIVNDSSALAWIAFVLLLVVALLGFTMFAIWLRRRQAGVGAASTDTPAEQHFPIAIVGLHGLLAATTLVLVLLAAAGVGGS
jgi:manganese efflux pump family protein